MNLAGKELPAFSKHRTVNNGDQRKHPISGCLWQLSLWSARWSTSNDWIDGAVSLWSFSIVPCSSRRWFYYHVRCLQNVCRKLQDWQLQRNLHMFATYSRFVCACEITQLLAQNIRNVFCRVRKTRGRLLQMSIRAKLRVAVIPLALLVLYYYSLFIEVYLRYVHASLN